MLWNTLLLALRTIRRNLMRSFLTILGIVIGVAAVITMVTLGNGATKSVSDQIASMGSNLLIVIPGQRFGGGSEGVRITSYNVCYTKLLRPHRQGDHGTDHHPQPRAGHHGADGDP